MTDIEKAASAIVAARRAGIRIPPSSGELTPSSIEEAYAIQDSAMRLLGPVGGWKTTISGDWRCSPIPADTILTTPAQISAGRPYKIEVEIGVMIGRDLDTQQDANTIRSAIASIHPAIEVVLSRFSEPVPMELGLADCQSCESVIAGPAIENWEHANLANMPLALSIDGEVVAATKDGASLDAMLPALAWLANQALARGLALRKGHFVITGARLKAPAPLGGCAITVEADNRPQTICLNLA